MSEDMETIIQIRLAIERLQQQVGRLGSNVDSEKGSISRTRQELREEISLLELKFNEVLFKPDVGLLIQLDRLVQESERRKKLQAQVVALWITVGGIILEQIFKLLIGK